ncbi:radical SAM protein [Lignipirellula cremea]|uniref:Antilisterial bacteriocin subtilosin biosynthesis protein AlbA n=1 Tax=Lignipirellula cremea TaxID=2528010 RepID=A0A518DNJ8_9BACT|nr:radical SAM protein [Lignipirellula cremea]QDU93409.1 Antilisterial bacteriocin subtilosin biosynthesis protein AlbA [Lignipirellula cremea]
MNLPPVDTTASPSVELSHLDHLWFQAAGTLCNLTCHHCFISCSPKNKNFGFLSLEEVQTRLAESATLGVKEYYFTGGEPFLNPDMTQILIATLQVGPATVLTNGTVLKEAWLTALRDTVAGGLYSLEFRVSIDGFSPETNDPIRGDGVFQRAMQGVQKLVDFGFLPIITAARTWPEEEDQETIARFVAMLKAAGYARPRLKILPALKLGAEEQRSGGYRESERIDDRLLEGFDRTQLVCEHSRIVTDQGVHVCPILIEAPDSLLGQTLAESQRPFPVSHGACYTCYLYGAICSNASSK